MALAKCCDLLNELLAAGEKLPSHIDTVAITAKIMQGIYDSAEQHREIVF